MRIYGLNMKLLMIPFFYLVGLFSISSVSAQEDLTLQRIEREEANEKLIEVIGEAKTLLNRMGRQWKTDCAKAVGYEPFCSCISKDIPSAWNFSDYIAITTKSKKENNYDQMDKNHRIAYDKVSPIRDKCVRIINK